MVRKLKPGTTILVADDEKLVIELTKRILSDLLGATVTCATDGAKAKEAVLKKGSPFDMILTDRDMPNVGGDELIEWMREVTPTTRIIMWSGNTNRTANMDADVFLTKPAPLQKLLGHIEALIPHCFEEVAPAAVQA